MTNEYHTLSAVHTFEKFIREPAAEHSLVVEAKFLKDNELRLKVKPLSSRIGTNSDD